MTNRELFRQIMFYGTFDRMLVVHWRGWPETRQRWIAEGMPADADERQFFNASPTWMAVGVHVDLQPYFEETTLEETAEWRIFRDREGVVQKAWKNQSLHSSVHRLHSEMRSGLEKYKARLQPEAARIPADLDQRIARAESSGFPVAIGTASMMGWIRNWMGVENMCYLMHDDPDVYADMVNTLADLTCWAIDQVAPRMKGPPDMGFGWEDICGKNGPLVSPSIFDRCVAPGYRKIRAKLESYGTHLLVWTATAWSSRCSRTGWMRASTSSSPSRSAPGTPTRTPSGASSARNCGYSADLTSWSSKKAPLKSMPRSNRRLPLMKEGGFMLIPDHLITPGTSLLNYRYFLERIRNLRF